MANKTTSAGNCAPAKQQQDEETISTHQAREAVKVPGMRYVVGFSTAAAALALLLLMYLLT